MTSSTAQKTERYRFGICDIDFFKYNSSNTTISDSNLGNFGKYLGEYIGTIKNVQEFNLTNEAELINAEVGGCLKRTPQTEEGVISSELSFTLNSNMIALDELFSGVAPVDQSADASGAVGTILNAEGTSMVDATTGIASVAALTGSEANIGFGFVKLQAATATTVDVFQAGSNLPILTGVSVAGTGATTDLTEVGIELTGGSGSIAFTVGDQAIIAVTPQNSTKITHYFDDNENTIEASMVVRSQENSSGEQTILHVRRVKLSGKNFVFTAKEFATFESTNAVLGTPDNVPLTTAFVVSTN